MTNNSLLKVMDQLHREHDFEKIQEVLGKDLEEGLRILEKNYRKVAVLKQPIVIWCYVVLQRFLSLAFALINIRIPQTVANDLKRLFVPVFFYP